MREPNKMSGIQPRGLLARYVRGSLFLVASFAALGLVLALTR
jgi:hypothetical protein